MYLFCIYLYNIYKDCTFFYFFIKQTFVNVHKRILYIYKKKKM